MSVRVGPPAVWVSMVVRTLVSFMGISGESVPHPPGRPAPEGGEKGAPPHGNIPRAGARAHPESNLSSPAAYEGMDDASREGKLR